jgi:aminopeptidase-like protein
MHTGELKQNLDFVTAGRDMYALMRRLYPVCRSITGDGVRETLRVLQEHIPLAIREVASGTPVFDWTVPREWNIQDAFIKDTKGNRVVDFKESNLCVVGYSSPVHKKMTFEELRPFLHTLPDQPDWIPYRTAYYDDSWGFCVSHRQLMAFKDDEEYEVCIDAAIEDGHLTYGEYYLPGQVPEEVLLSCHVCHPSLCNDNLSGIVLLTTLGRILQDISLRYSYRFLFIPGTIGSITWLALNEDEASNIQYGLVAACVGDAGHMTYKRSRRGNAPIDSIVEHVLRESADPYDIKSFIPYGYDERQYCSPGFNLPVGCLQRTSYGDYPEYHTSADDCDFVHRESLQDSLQKYISVLDVIENNRTFVNTNPKCEPQLGKRGLYKAIGGQGEVQESQMAMLWILNLSDGEHSLLDISDKSKIRFDVIKNITEILVTHGLLRECP